MAKQDYQRKVDSLLKEWLGLIPEGMYRKMRDTVFGDEKICCNTWAFKNIGCLMMDGLCRDDPAVFKRIKDADSKEVSGALGVFYKCPASLILNGAIVFDAWVGSYASYSYPDRRNDTIGYLSARGRRALRKIFERETNQYV